MTNPETSSRPRVLFICTGNACRSQMAEGWLRHLAGRRIEALSAGTEPHGLNQRAVAAMADLGIDISAHESKHLDLYLPPSTTAPDVVITVCSDAAERCPVFPAGVTLLRWPFPDPAPGGVDCGADEVEIVASFREVCDAIGEHIGAWLASGAEPLGLD